MKNRIRLGILALPASGVVTTISVLLPGVFINPSIDPEGFAQAAGSIGMGNLLGIVALVLWLIGAHALYSVLEGTVADRWALVALMLSFAGIGLFLPFAGVLAFVAPVAGGLYLNGDKDAVSVITGSIAISNPWAVLFGGMSVLFFTAGSIIFGLVIWQCQRLPKWSGIVYALAGTLSFISAPFYSFTLGLLGGLLLVISGGWIATCISRADGQAVADLT